MNGDHDASLTCAPYLALPADACEAEEGARERLVAGEQRVEEMPEMAAVAAVVETGAAAAAVAAEHDGEHPWAAA